jgi:hypothetical protein
MLFSKILVGLSFRMLCCLPWWAKATPQRVASPLRSLWDWTRGQSPHSHSRFPFFSIISKKYTLSLSSCGMEISMSICQYIADEELVRITRDRKSISGYVCFIWSYLSWGWFPQLNFSESGPSLSWWHRESLAHAQKKRARSEKLAAERLSIDKALYSFRRPFTIRISPISVKYSIFQLLKSKRYPAQTPLSQTLYSRSKERHI